MRPWILWSLIISLPVSAVSGHAQGCRVLVYNTWSDPADGGYANDHYDEDLIGILTSEGYAVTLVSRGEEPVITESLLSPYQELWLIAANNRQVEEFLPSELSVIAGFHEAKNGIAIFGEHDHFFEDINVIAELFGGVFTGTGVNQDEAIGTDGFPPHPAWENVAFIGGAVSEGDIEVLNTGFLEVIAFNNGAYMVAVHNARGRVLLDSSFVRLFNLEFMGQFATSAVEYDNEIYLANIARWLFPCEATPVDESSWGRLKSTYR
jgi:hypothetical protein